MLKFDPESIYQKELEELQQDPNWRVVANNSVVTALMRSTAEVISETARYSEYLFKESKWDTAQNPNSILSMAGLLGYKPKRKISAEGTLVISTDSRIHNVGKTISSTVFKNIETEYNSFSPAWSKGTIEISPLYTTIIDSQGRSYIPLNSETETTPTYSKNINIIQGQRKSTFIDISTIKSLTTKSLLDPYLYIPVKIDSCENAGKVTSKQFFRLYVVSGTEEKEYRIVDSLLFSSGSDYDVEVYNDLYSRNLFYLKFNNDKTRGNVLDISSTTSLTGIRLDYLETLGEAGNNTTLYENYTITTTLNGVTTRYYGVNYNPIIGGSDEESVLDIKTNAPKHYIESYTTGTKEAYETAIKNITFPLGGTTVKPEKVNVYGGHITNNGFLQPVTCVSFISDNLDDLLENLEEETLSETSISEDRIYLKIEETLNYYLARLKAPQDTFRFIPPDFVTFAIGVNCSISKDDVSDLRQLESNIRDLVSESWSTTSDERDFGRSFYTSSVIKDILNSSDKIVSTDLEIEATKKLKWTSAVYEEPPRPSGEGTMIYYHTCRMPFSFNRVFLGSKSIKGFKDYRSGSKYVMRVDFMYKKPAGLAQVNSNDYHVSIFVEDSSTVNVKEDDEEIVRLRNYDAFYLKKDLSNIWDIDRMLDDQSYSELGLADPLSKSYQYRYKEKVYTDNDFRALINNQSSDSYTSTISTYIEDLGAVDDYLIYFSAKYDESKDEIGDGWIEFTFDPIYTLLETFALYDPELKYKLQKCPLSLLKCETSTKEQINVDAFQQFLEIAAEYIDIYVSMRPVDSDLCLSTDTTNSGGVVLQIDSEDIDSVTSNIGNLTTNKKNRMISVTCEYKD